MKISKNLIALIVTVVGSVLLGVQLQADQAFMFFYRESQQLLFQRLHLLVGQWG